MNIEPISVNENIHVGEENSDRQVQIPIHRSKFPALPGISERKSDRNQSESVDVTSGRGTSKSQEVKNEKQIERKKSMNESSNGTLAEEDSKNKQYQTDVNLSLSESLVPNHYSRYPRVVVGDDDKKAQNSGKNKEKTSVSEKKLSTTALQNQFEEMDSKQWINLLKIFSPEKLLSIKDCVSKAIEVKTQEVIAEKKMQIETLKKEVEDLEKMV